MKYIGIVGRVEETVDGSHVIGLREYYRKVFANYDDVYPLLILPPKDILYGKTYSSDELKENIELNSKLDSLLDLCDGFVIIGGTRWFSYDAYVIRYALEHDKPILGICLGMQVMGVLDNKVNQGIFDKTSKIEPEFSHQVLDKDYAHEVSIVHGSKLESILKTTRCKVNSRHCYCILGVIDFKVSAYSEEGIIEAIEHPSKKFAIGVQWHPELMAEYDPVMRKLFDAFVDAILESSKVLI